MKKKGRDGHMRRKMKSNFRVAEKFRWWWWCVRVPWTLSWYERRSIDHLFVPASHPFEREMLDGEEEKERERERLVAAVMQSIL